MSRDESNIPPELREVLEGHRSDGQQSSDLEEVWDLLDDAVPSDEDLPEAEDTWAGVREHIEGSSEENERRADDHNPADRSSARPSAQQRRWRWGSAVAVLLVLAVAGWWWMRPLSVRTAPGATVTHTLPDGSTVELNADSRLAYDRTFSTVSLLQSERRLVRLRGEAFFEVEDGVRPFVVQTPTAQIEVVGTSFSVNSRVDEEEGTLVALAEGQLRVTGRTANARTTSVQPGQAVTVGRTGPLTAVRDTSIDRVTVWRRGGFAVTGAPLPDLAEALERRFGQTIQLDASISESMRTAPLTLYYAQNADLEQILHDICMARNLTYRSTANGFVLSRAGDTQASRLP
ncbi:hypothetical protein BSZ35_10345 [Salinibacter sp. 10B]|uniref:FecR family protein n=1 Tax=Salinibacter sp. 10B TaxID=1923971 RepID=UPI000CF42CD4|nr:FecR family protein [Salinibacter sp. 10B]PQJ34943.1 hypothetical protein BSZ35_10345 [Salinibacter sp. 10B]